MAPSSAARSRLLSGWSSIWVLLFLLLATVSSQVPPGQRLLGGAVEAPAGDEGVRRAVQFAVGEFNRASNDKFASRPAQLISAHKQLVSGINYILEIKLARTTCTKSVNDLENCPFHEAPRQTICRFVVYVVPWMGKISLTSQNCHN